MDIKDFLESICLAIAAGLIATVYRAKLAYGLLNKWFVWGSQFEGRWFYDPIWGCAPCFSGQFALWVYVLLHFRPVILLEKGAGWSFMLKTAIDTINMPYSITGHLTAICGAIFFTAIFYDKFNKAENGTA